MDKGTAHAYEWAKGQNYQSVAADYARALAIEIDRLNTELERVASENSTLEASAKRNHEAANLLSIDCKSLRVENARLRAELEAANGDLWLIAIGKEPCDVCAHKGKDAKESPCVTCYGSDFEWRGLVPNTPNAEADAHETGGGEG